MSDDSFSHLGSIWYQSEPLEVPYCPNQFLAFSYCKPSLEFFVLYNFRNRANPGEVSTDSSSLAKIKNILNPKYTFLHSGAIFKLIFQLMILPIQYKIPSLKFELSSLPLAILYCNTLIKGLCCSMQFLVLFNRVYLQLEKQID